MAHRDAFRFQSAWNRKCESDQSNQSRKALPPGFIGNAVGSRTLFPGACSADHGVPSVHTLSDAVRCALDSIQQLLDQSDSLREAPADPSVRVHFRRAGGSPGSVMRCGSRISFSSFSLSTLSSRHTSGIVLPVFSDFLTTSAARE